MQSLRGFVNNQMSEKLIYIKNMVCPRCVTAVEQTLAKLNISFTEVKLGMAKIENSQVDYLILNRELKTIGFELIKDKNLNLVERIKTLIIDYIYHFENNDLNINFSNYIAKKVGDDYSYISNVFSKTEDITIEKYIILQKIEKVKELITYDELNFSEIAFKINYSSISHLSKQFKKITGITLSQYKYQRAKSLR